MCMTPPSNGTPVTTSPDAQVWVHGLMATMHAYVVEMNEHIALHDVRSIVPL